jgi:hypothetical protein
MAIIRDFQIELIVFVTDSNKKIHKLIFNVSTKAHKKRRVRYVKHWATFKF